MLCASAYARSSPAIVSINHFKAALLVCIGASKIKGMPLMEQEMAITTIYAKLLGTYEPMPEEGVKKMEELIAADQAV